MAGGDAGERATDRRDAVRQQDPSLSAPTRGVHIDQQDVGYCCAICPGTPGSLKRVDNRVDHESRAGHAHDAVGVGVEGGTRSSTIVAFMAETLSELCAALSLGPLPSGRGNPIDNRVDICRGARLSTPERSQQTLVLKPSVRAPHVPELAPARDVGPAHLHEPAAF